MKVVEGELLPSLERILGPFYGKGNQKIKNPSKHHNTF
jgi:hypothetical protein